MTKSEEREILKAAIKGTKRRPFAAVLAAIPDVGEDGDFERQLSGGDSKEMGLRIFESTVANEAEFVEFWSKRYAYPKPELYMDAIRRPLTTKSVLELYEWKNGGKMSAGKRASVKKHYIPRLGDKPPKTTDAKVYVSTLGGGAIWNLFWLHCKKPAVYPIFDQHTYRAMAVIDGLPEREIPTGDAKKIRAYFETYLPFLERFRSLPSRKVDKALFAFGRFVKSSFELT